MEQKHKDERVYIGFWIYLMTDLLMFAVLFAVFAVLRNNTFGHATIKEIFNPPYVLVETIILLTSSYTCGIATLYAHNSKKNAALFFIGLTLLLGIAFLLMEVVEFRNLILEGNDFTKSAFLSSFFTLVGTHGAHIFAGSLWIFILIIQIMRRGLTQSNIRKLTLAGLFWHFLDVVWIFIFTVVYLMGGVL
jgi:cytochrome o ubiquinol oxidase subunit 3